MQTISRLLRSPLVQGIRYIVSIALIAYLATKVDLAEVAKALNTAGMIPFLASLGLAAAAYPVCAVRWWVLLRSTGTPLPFRRAHQIVWIGQFYNAFLPGGIGGDATRLVYAFQDWPDRRAAATTATAADRINGFATLLLLGTAAIVAYALAGHAPSHATTLVSTLVVASALTAGGILLLPVLAPRLPTAWSTPLLQLRRDVPGAILATGLSVGVWLFDFLSGWILARALGLEIGPVEIGLALALAYLSALLPISLGGHGIREGALVLAISWLSPAAGANPEIVAAFALLFLVVNLACSLFGGLTLLLSRRS